MFGFFNRKPQRDYVLLARYTAGAWFRQFTIKAPSSYEACRKFDTSEESLYWTRVSGATVTTL